MEKKVALVTGGTAGIGKHTALMLAANGVKIVIAGRTEQFGHELVQQIRLRGGEAIFVATDVSLEREVVKLVETAIKTFGRIDFLFNNAGTEGTLGPLESNSEEVIDQVLAVNIKGVLLAIKHVLPLMKQQNSGIIVNTASFVGTTLPLPVAVAYGASKSAVLSITRAAAASITEDAVRIYALCPWVTDTPMADRLMGHDEQAKAAFGENINPSRAIVPVDEIASVALKLFFGTTALANGEAILVDNGIINRIHAMNVGDRLTL